VLRGDPGVGKTALVGYVVEQASDCRVVRAAGVQAEIELAFAGVHQLCAPMLDRLERLPVPQRDAVRTAFGISTGSAPDRFFVALAVLGLLSDVAEDQPLICVVELAGLPELVVEGLPEDDARALLDTVLTGPVDARVRDQIISETRGNPLALLELPCGVTLLNWPAGSDSRCPARCRCPGGSRTASGGGSTLSRRRPGALCSSRRPIPSANRRWCGKRPNS
jgi:hypothetical protein